MDLIAGVRKTGKIFLYLALEDGEVDAGQEGMRIRGEHRSPNSTPAPNPKAAFSSPVLCARPHASVWRKGRGVLAVWLWGARHPWLWLTLAFLKLTFLSRSPAPVPVHANSFQFSV